MALNWLSGRKIDHPMASMKKAREMVDALPRGESVRALEDAASWLDSIDREPEFKLDYRLELLDLIDRGAKAHWHAVDPNTSTRHACKSSTRTVCGAHSSATGGRSVMRICAA